VAAWLLLTWLNAKRDTRIFIFFVLCCIYPGLIVLALIWFAITRK